MDVRLWHGVAAAVEAETPCRPLLVAGGPDTALSGSLLGVLQVSAAEPFNSETAERPMLRFGTAAADSILPGAVAAQLDDADAVGTPLHAKNFAAALLLSRVYLHCTMGLPRRDELLTLLHDAVQIARAAAPMPAAAACADTTVGAGAANPALGHVVLLLSAPTTAAMAGGGSSTSEQRIARWFSHVEPTYDDDGRPRAGAQRRNEMRVAVGDALASPLRVVLLPPHRGARDRLVAALRGEAVGGRIRSTQHAAPRLLDGAALVDRIAALRLSPPDATWSILQREWLLARARAVVAEDFAAHLEARRDRITRSYVEAQRDHVIGRCEAIVGAAGVEPEAHRQALCGMHEALDPLVVTFLAIANEVEAAGREEAARGGRGNAGRWGRGGNGGSSSAAAGLGGGGGLLWLRALVPARYEYWATPQGLCVLLVALLFVLGSFASFSFGGGKVKPAGK